MIILRTKRLKPLLLLQTLSYIDLPFEQLKMKDLCDHYDERVKKTQQSESAYVKEEVSLP